MAYKKIATHTRSTYVKVSLFLYKEHVILVEESFNLGKILPYIPKFSEFLSHQW